MSNYDIRIARAEKTLACTPEYRRRPEPREAITIAVADLLLLARRRGLDPSTVAVMARDEAEGEVAEPSRPRFGVTVVIEADDEEEAFDFLDRGLRRRADEGPCAVFAGDPRPVADRDEYDSPGICTALLTDPEAPWNEEFTAGSMPGGSVA